MCADRHDNSSDAYMKCLALNLHGRKNAAVFYKKCYKIGAQKHIHLLIKLHTHA